MAEPKVKGGFPEVATPKNYVFAGYAGETQEFASIFIDPSEDPLNPDGLRELANQKELRKKAGLPERDELEVRVYPPFPVDGVEKYVDPEFLKAWKAAWDGWAKPKGIDVKLDLDKLILGQMRIDLNRDYTTPEGYKRFTVAMVKLSQRAKKQGKKAKALSFGTAL